MDYKKKALNKFSRNQDYEEIDTRLASGWYVDAVTGNKKKKYKTKEVVFKIAKKSDQSQISDSIKILQGKLLFPPNIEKILIQKNKLSQ